MPSDDGFEAWKRDAGCLAQEGSFSDAWLTLAWQAARRAALEECAAVADRTWDKYDDTTWCASRIADAIRAKITEEGS